MASSSEDRPLASVIVSQSDVIRLLREVDQLDEQRSQFVIQRRFKATSMEGASHASIGLQELAVYYDLSLETDEGRDGLRKMINRLLTQAPQLHISFASEPPIAQLRTVVDWLRHNIHATVLVQTSVQPAIVAGCVVRSSSKVFDLSLRHSFEAAMPQLVKEVRAL